MGKGQELYNKAKTIIPGGTQLLSKRPEMFLPDLWPAYYSKAKGCQVWDLDGNAYIDVSYMGIGANILGYAHDEVDTAAKQAIDNSSMCTLNAPEEVELAEKILTIHPWADMVRYSKTGGEAMAIAVRIARAHTEKDIVLFCGYHGWHDWYLSTNLKNGDALNSHLLSGLEPLGVPKTLTETTIPFMYNCKEEFNELIAKYNGKIAAVVMEPVRNDLPTSDFLTHIRKITQENNIVLIFDEITAGFRLCCGGSHLILSVNPDIAVLGKALGNGHPLSMVIGKRGVMQSAQSTFISSTYWTERVGLSAALATIKFYQEHNVDKHINAIGKKIQQGWSKLAEKHGINLAVGGIYPLGHFTFKYSNPLAYKTFFTQCMLKKGYLASTAFYVSYAHTPDIVNKYLDDCDAVFESIADIIRKDENVTDYLQGPVCHAGFARLN